MTWRELAEAIRTQIPERLLDEPAFVDANRFGNTHLIYCVSLLGINTQLLRRASHTYSPFLLHRRHYANNLF